ncbi:phosphoglycerate dehydrogenase [Ottowia thiooxydans]|uniref:phosphoglycerate dehydrogenase n=1 Tax=Ottowia thiooxydans TaxID=219182 RepID=UPI00041EEBF6|nr:phosphoglycerate dehydrogenase [Ottowia thiooxydans]
MGNTLNDDARQRVLVTAKSVANCDAAIAMMRDAKLDVVIKNTPMPIDEAWLKEQVHDIDALVFAMEPMGEKVLQAANRLKLIARPGVGYDNVDIDFATRRGILVSTAAGTNDQSVADFTFALMLEAMRGVSRASNGVNQGGWDRVTGTELWKKTIAVIGMGRIGKGVARRARGFDMDVLAVGREPDHDFERAYGVRYCSLQEALSKADIVSLHLPLNPSTEDLINSVTLGQMKPGAYLINTARGGLIDEQALVEAVGSGQLSGAAIDVLREQGAGSKSCLIGVDGITVTPHMATFTHESIERVAMSVAESVIAGLRGNMPRHVVNPGAWTSQPFVSAP